jgi:hypothetical protein
MDVWRTLRKSSATLDMMAKTVVGGRLVLGVQPRHCTELPVRVLNRGDYKLLRALRSAAGIFGFLVILHGPHFLPGR